MMCGPFNEFLDFLAYSLRVLHLCLFMLLACYFLVSVVYLSGFGHRVREGNGTPLQYCCLENPMDGGAWWATIYGAAQSQTRLKQLSSSSSRP